MIARRILPLALVFGLIPPPVSAQPPLAAPSTLQEMAVQLSETQRQVGFMQQQIQLLSQQLQGHAQAIATLTSRANAGDILHAAAQKRLDMDAQALYANGEQLQQLQQGMLAAHQSILALRGQIAQIEAAMAQQGAWLLQSNAAAVNLSATANEALQRALTAGKLAEGKLLYEEVLSQELTQFAPYKAELSEAAKEALKVFAARLKEENANVFLEIQGHTDRSGSRSRNLKISQARAEAVRALLNAEGIPLHRMSVIAYGDTKPVADNATAEGRAKNRRVTIVVLK